MGKIAYYGNIIKRFATQWKSIWWTSPGWSVDFIHSNHFKLINAKKHTFCLRPLSHNFGISCHWQAFWHWPMNCTPSTLSTSSCLQTWTQKRLGAVQWLVTDRRVHLPSQFVATAVQKRCRGVRQLINQAQASLNQPGRQTACQSHHRKGNQIRQARCRAVQ